MPCVPCSAPPRNPHALRRPAVAAALAIAALMAGCAPPAPRPAVTADLVRERHVSGVRSRAGHASAEAEVLVWSQVRGERLPGVDARLVLGAPDMCRLRVRALLGTAIDISVFGDSLLAWIPPERAGVALDAAGDSLGVREPGARAWRTLAATWRAPDEAWDAAQRSDSGLVLSWLDGGDAVTMRLDDEGRPLAIAWHGADARGFEVRYEGWLMVDGVAWPERMTADLDDGSFVMRLRAARWRFTGDLRPRLSMPAHARLLGRQELLDALRAWWDG